MPAATEQKPTSQRLMEIATDRAGSEAEEIFRGMTRQVIAAMLDDSKDYICIKKNSTGKIVKITTH